MGRDEHCRHDIGAIESCPDPVIYRVESRLIARRKRPRSLASARVRLAAPVQQRSSPSVGPSRHDLCAGAQGQVADARGSAATA